MSQNKLLAHFLFHLTSVYEVFLEYRNTTDLTVFIQFYD